ACTGGGVSAWLLRRARREKKANIDTIEGVEDLKVKHPDMREEINATLAERHSSTPLDMNARVKEVQWERERQKKFGQKNAPVAKV
ncbi:MAG TPA: hypothetical protein ACFYEA_02560, partial [Candidatus Tripitaka californicus]|uniref:hypothetical protein n=1 Tax=Candidatus Tripitaka californicus TaxID=3367616 RepID=UPI004026A7CA